MSLKFERLRSLCGKAIVALLLLFAALSPSIAEAGHFEDVLAHQVQVSVGITADSVSDGTRDREDRSNPVEKGTHCAFSHCAHAAVSLPGADVAPGNAFSRSANFSADLPMLVGLTSPTPDQPPRA